MLSPSTHYKVPEEINMHSTKKEFHIFCRKLDLEWYDNKTFLLKGQRERLSPLSKILHSSLPYLGKSQRSAQ